MNLRIVSFRQLALLGVLLVTALSHRPSATAHSDAERWIRDVSATGGVARIDAQFPNHDQRHLTSRFLEELITNTNASVHRHGVRIENAVFDDPVDLINARIEHEVQIDNSVFLGPVDLSGSHFARGLLLRGCFFASNLVCSRLQVEGSLDFGSRTMLPALPLGHELDSSNLLGRVTKELQQRGVLLGQDGKIWRLDEKNSCYLVSPQEHVLLSLTFHDGVLEMKRVGYLGGKVNEMKDMQIGQHLNLSDAVVAGDLEMDSLKVGGSASFEFAVFQGATSFGYARITDELNGRGACFLNDPAAKFYGLRTDGRIKLGDVWFEGDVDFSEAKAGALGVWNSVFRGLADFTRMSIANDFNAERAVFVSTNDFTGLKVSGNAVFEGALFTGRAEFVSCTIHGELIARAAKFFEDVMFEGMQVDGGAVFPQSLFKRSVSFKNAKLNRFELEEVNWPERANCVHFEGLSYSRIRASREDLEHERTWETLSQRLSESEVLSPDVYEHLEDFFRREGKPTLANEVYIAYKVQERKKILWPNVEIALKQGDHVQTLVALWSWSVSFIWDWGTAYGKRPWQALVTSLIVVLIGCLMFPRGHMEPDNLENGSVGIKYDFHAPPYNRFAYSLDLFIPVLHFHYDDRWVPTKEAPWWVHTWRYFQIIAGWVLVPLFLVSGLAH
jgi:hypothetical protein